MPDPADLAAVEAAIIDAAAKGIESVTVDGNTTTARPLKDLIEAENHLARKAALGGTSARGGARSGWNALRPAKSVPPGAI